MMDNGTEITELKSHINDDDYWVGFCSETEKLSKVMRC